MHVTFVLLSSAAAPDARRVAESYAALFGEPLLVEAGARLKLRSRAGAEALATFVAVPITTGEVESAAKLSVARFADVEIDSAHVAHLIVATGADSTPEARRQHCMIVAALAQAADALAIYDGAAGATHPTDFFLYVIANEDPPVRLWTGVSLATPHPDQISLLTMGLPSFDLPNLLIDGRISQAEECLDFLLSTAEYMISRGSALADGDTIGRSRSEKLCAKYVASPIDPTATVIHIDFGEADGG